MKHEIKLGPASPQTLPSITGATIMSKQTPTNDPMVGTWKVNLSKSTYSPGPPPKSTINKFEPWEDGMKATIDIVDAQGEKIHSEAAVKFDGKDYPIKGSPIADAVSVK